MPTSVEVRDKHLRECEYFERKVQTHSEMEASNDVLEADQQTKNEAERRVQLEVSQRINHPDYAKKCLIDRLLLGAPDLISLRTQAHNNLEYFRELESKVRQQDAEVQQGVDYLEDEVRSIRKDVAQAKDLAVSACERIKAHYADSGANDEEARIDRELAEDIALLKKDEEELNARLQELNKYDMDLSQHNASMMEPKTDEKEDMTPDEIQEKLKIAILKGQQKAELRNKMERLCAELDIEVMNFNTWGVLLQVAKKFSIKVPWRKTGGVQPVVNLNGTLNQNCPYTPLEMLDSENLMVVQPAQVAISDLLGRGYGFHDLVVRIRDRVP